MVIDNKGGEIVYKDSEKTTKKETKGEIIYDKGRGSIKILSIQIGGASSWTCMVHLNVYFIYLLAWYKVLNLNIHACVMYSSHRLEWWNEILDSWFLYEN